MRSSRIQSARKARAGSAIGTHPRAAHSRNPSPVIACLPTGTYLFWKIYKRGNEYEQTPSSTRNIIPSNRNPNMAGGNGITLLNR